jgi:hypothetical protein
MNWDSPEARLALIESVGHEEYNRRLQEHLGSRPDIYPVNTRFGLLYAVKGTTAAFSTRKQAENYLAKKEKYK